MVDIAGAAASGPQLYGRSDPLVNGAQTSQIAADGVSPDQAFGVTAPGDLDAEGDGSGGQGDFENPASGENIVQAQLAGSDELAEAEDVGYERPLSPIEEAILDFPPDAVVQSEDTFSLAATDAADRQAGGATVQGTEAAAEESAAQFGVSEVQSEEQAEAAQREDASRAAADEEANRESPEPRSTISGASDDPFNIANGSAAQSGGGSAATQPPGSTVDIAA